MPEAFTCQEMEKAFTLHDANELVACSAAHLCAVCPVEVESPGALLGRPPAQVGFKTAHGLRVGQGGRGHRRAVALGADHLNVIESKVANVLEIIIRPVEHSCSCRRPTRARVIPLVRRTRWRPNRSRPRTPSRCGTAGGPFLQTRHPPPVPPALTG
jgi:hypothetical protein